MFNDSDSKWRRPELFPITLIFEKLAKIIGDLLDWLFGKAKGNIDIILYGPPVSGKTTFFKFLTSKEIIKEDNTVQFTNSIGKTIKFRKLKDLPGDERLLIDLRKIIKATKNENSNIAIWIVYFIALPMIIEEGYLEIDKKKKETIELFKKYSSKYTKDVVESDLNGIKEIIGQYKEGEVNSLIIFNFADLYPLYSQNKSLFAKKIINYTYNWITSEKAYTATKNGEIWAGGTSQVEYVIGSLGNEKEAEILITKTLQKIVERTNSFVSSGG
jgi:hypothetical protein